MSEFKSRLRRRLRKLSLKLAVAGREPSERQAFDCPMCGYHGPFKPRFGTVAIRLDAGCPACKSLERHRHIALWLKSEPNRALGDVLHFAPERILKQMLRDAATTYVTTDIQEGLADLVLNIEALDVPDNSYDTIICNHVLEHVDDSRALPEMLRVLRPSGLALLTFPVIASWPTSYEPDGITTDHDRHRHFGQSDHVRFFGWDVVERIKAAGFKLTVLPVTGAEAAAHGIDREQVIFLCEKG